MSSSNVGVIKQEDIFIIIGGKRITGFPKGQFYVASKASDDVEVEDGCDGEIAMIENASELWNVTITLMQTSRSNDFMWKFREAARNALGGILLPMAIIHHGTKLVSAGVRIRKPPDISFSNGVETRVWPIIAPNYEGTLQGLTMTP